MSKLYIGNLAHETTEAELRAAFAAYGDISSIKIAADRRGRVKGFAYVEMPDEAAAQKAMESLKGTQINGRTMDIVEDNARGRRGGGFRPGGRKRH